MYSWVPNNIILLFILPYIVVKFKLPHHNTFSILVDLIWCMVVFNQESFYGEWFLPHIQRADKNGSPCSMECATIGDSGEWIWIWLHSCEFGNSSVLVRVAITICFPGDGKFVSGTCASHDQGCHILIWQIVWSVSFDWGKEGVVFSSFISLGFW